MSVAYVCDSEVCGKVVPAGSSVGAKVLKVEPGLIAILPKGWIEVEVAEGAGVANATRRKYHLCPSCASGFRGNLPRALP